MERLRMMKRKASNQLMYQRISPAGNGHQSWRTLTSMSKRLNRLTHYQGIIYQITDDAWVDVVQGLLRLD